MLRTKAFGIVVTVVVVTVAVTVSGGDSDGDGVGDGDFGSGSMGVTLQQMLFSVILTVSQRTDQPVSSIQLHE